MGIGSSTNTSVDKGITSDNTSANSHPQPHSSPSSSSSSSSGASLEAINHIRGEKEVRIKKEEEEEEEDIRQVGVLSCSSSSSSSSSSGSSSAHSSVVLSTHIKLEKCEENIFKTEEVIEEEASTTERLVKIEPPSPSLSTPTIPLNNRSTLKKEKEESAEPETPSPASLLQSSASYLTPSLEYSRQTIKSSPAEEGEPESPKPNQPLKVEADSDSDSGERIKTEKQNVDDNCSGTSSTSDNDSTSQFQHGCSTTATGRGCNYGVGGDFHHYTVPVKKEETVTVDMWKYSNSFHDDDELLPDLETTPVLKKEEALFPLSNRLKRGCEPLEEEVSFPLSNSSDIGSSPDLNSPELPTPTLSWVENKIDGSTVSLAPQPQQRDLESTTPIILSEEQEKILNAALEEKNMFITGFVLVWFNQRSNNVLH
jgi:hypothetical protein